jgi:muramidase (phage lysozyme)
MAQLGTVSASSRPIAPIAPQGGGVGAGLQVLAKGIGNLSSAFGDAASANNALLDVAFNNETAQLERQKRLDKSAALIGLTKLQGQHARDMIDFQSNYVGADYSRAASEQLESKLTPFVQSLPSTIQEEFLPVIETYRQNQMTENYGAQLSRDGQFYALGATDLQTEGMKAISSGTGSLQSWRPIIEEYFQNSPFPPAATEKMKREALAGLESVAALQQATDERLHPSVSAGSVDGFPPGISPQLRGFFNAVIGKESGGKANVMYGGRTFSDYSQHPNDPAVITSGPNAGKKSSAAGVLQFIKGTWDYVQEKLNLPDFSPENQIRGGVFLAKEDYAKRTGRDLESDLASGDPAILAQVRREMAGTWEGLGNMSDEEFIAAVQSGESTPSSIMTDPAYENLSYEELLRIDNTAASNASETQRALLAEQKQALALSIDTMQRGIASGQIQDSLTIAQFANDNQLTFEQETSLQDLFIKTNKDTTLANTFASSAQNGDFITEETKKGFDVLYNKGGGQAMAERSAEYLQGTFIPQAAASNYIPPVAAAQLSGMARSGDPQTAEFAYTAMAALKTQAPAAFASLPSETQAELGLYTGLSQYYSSAELLTMISESRKPENKQQQAVVAQIVNQEIAKDPLAFTPVGIAEELDLEPTFDAVSGSAFAYQYRTLYESALARGLSSDAAREMAKGQIEARWGETDIGGSTYTMQLPPQLAGVPTVAGDYAYIEDIVRKDAGLGPEVSFKIGSDLQTQAELAAGKPPSYTVSTDTGIGLPLMRADGKQLRVSFDKPQDPTAATPKALQLEGSIWFNKVRNSNEALLRGANSPTYAGRAVAGLFSEINKELRANAPEGGKYFLREGTPAQYPVQLDDAQRTLLLDVFGYSSISEMARDGKILDYNTAVEMLNSESLSAEERALLEGLVK